MPESYPRVLVLNGSAFGGHSATAVTLTNLFQGWPSERLALAHLDEQASNPGGGLCRRVWHLSLADVPVYRAVRKLLGRHRERVVGWAAPGMPGGLGASSGGSAVTWRSRVHGVASAWADLLPLYPPPAFWAWVAEFQPEVIYSVLGSTRMLGLVRRLAVRFDVPVVPHFMDDWPATHYRGWANYIPRKALLARLRSVIEGAPVGMSIGPAMADEYQQRYGIRFQAFMNCVEAPPECPTGESGQASSPLKFVYIGGLHLNRWQSLQDIGKALLALCAEGCAAELVVHAPAGDLAQYGGDLAAIGTVRLGGALRQDGVALAMRNADVLVHVESFEPRVRDYTRLSLSTKLPQYMVCGKPILAYGPGDLASCRYIQDCQCGVVVGEQNANLLLEAVRSLAGDPQRRARLGRRGWKEARENHRSSVVRERFRSVLADAASRAVGRSRWIRPTLAQAQ